MSRPESLRVLITRLSHIGDCVLTLPVACAVKERWPHAFIAWAVERPSNQLLEGHPAIDQLIVVDRGYLKSFRTARQLRRQIRSLRFDVSLDPQSLTKSAALGWLSGIPRRIGFARGVGREAAPLLNNLLVQPTSRHLVDRSLELLRPLDVLAPDVRFCPPHYQAAAAKVESFLDQKTSRGFAVINPGAGWPSKIWPAERYATVAQHLGRKWSLPSIIVWAGDRERSSAQTIVTHSGRHAVSAPLTNLQELSEILRRARLFVGSDTGPLHMAAAVGTPCVSMYGPTLPAHCGPYGEGHVALQQYLQTGTCRERRKADNVAMRAIQAITVCDACDEVLGRQRHDSNGRAA